MPWWGWLLLLVAAIWGATSFVGRTRDRRARALIHIPESGQPTISLRPPSPLPADLALLALCYASKIRWILRNEPPMIQQLHRELCGELVDFWNEGGGDLIDRSPTAAAVRAAVDAPRAVTGGESFKVDLFRTAYRNLTNKGYVLNTLPKPGLAANIPWSSIHLFNVAFVLSADSDRARFHRATSAWFAAAYSDAVDYQGLAGLNALFALSYASVAEAYAT